LASVRQSSRKRVPSKKAQQLESDALTKSCQKRNHKKVQPKLQQDEEWVKCDKCNKWQMLPSNIKADTLPDDWDCSKIVWEPSCKSCTAHGAKETPSTKEGDDSSEIEIGNDGLITGRSSNRRKFFGMGKTRLFDKDKTDESEGKQDIDDDDDDHGHILSTDSFELASERLRSSSDDDDGSRSNNLELTTGEKDRSVILELSKKPLENIKENAENDEEENEGNDSDVVYPEVDYEYENSDEDSSYLFDNDQHRKDDGESSFLRYDEVEDKENNSADSNAAPRKKKRKGGNRFILPGVIDALNENELGAIDDTLEHICFKRLRNDNNDGSYPLKNITGWSKKSRSLLEGSPSGKKQAELMIEYSEHDIATFWTLKGDSDQRLVLSLPSHCFETAYLENYKDFIKYIKLVTNYENFFQYKVIDILIWHGIHYSKVFVVNPGMILNPGNSDPDACSCILYCNSMTPAGVHTKEKVTPAIIQMLNWVCRDQHLNEPFNRTNLIAYNLKVPFQKDSWSCGFQMMLARDSFVAALLNKRFITKADCEDNFTTYAEENMSYNESDSLALRRDLFKIVDGLTSLSDKKTSPYPKESNTNNLKENRKVKEDEKSKKDDDDDDDVFIKKEASIQTEDQPPIEKMPLNPRCIKSIKSHFPKGYRKLQPINNYRTSNDKVLEWFNLTREEQLDEKKKFHELSSGAKKRIKDKISGDPVSGCNCTGCKGRKTRSDVGVAKKGKRKRKRKSILNGKEEDVSEYVSLAHASSDRGDLVEKNKNRKKNATRQKKGKSNRISTDQPTTVQQQCSQVFMEKLHTSMIAVQQALTSSYYHSEHDAPRVRGSLIFRIGVKEAPQSGGIIPDEDLRREKDLVIRLSTSKNDFIDNVNLFTEDYRETCEIQDYFGVGQENLDRIHTMNEDRKKVRHKKAKVAKNTNDIIDENDDPDLFSVLRQRHQDASKLVLGSAGGETANIDKVVKLKKKIERQEEVIKKNKMILQELTGSSSVDEGNSDAIS
jgi:hypothetical protein